MYYVCIENNLVTGIMSYEPAVPEAVRTVTISDEQYNQIMAQTHRFDITTNNLVSVPSQELEQKARDVLNAVEREFLNSTDWKVMRHIRQKALGEITSLTEEQYLELEQQRSGAAGRIV